MEKFFVPHELKTIEIDVEKKVFKINGENFGKGCTGFTITCGGLDDFSIEVELNARIQYATYQGKSLTFVKEHPAYALNIRKAEDNTR